MKVYRFMALKEDASYSEKELEHLKKGIVCPSSEYFKYTKNPRAGLNSFNNASALNKYFFASLLDALRYQNNFYNRMHLQGKNVECLIWEVDIPNNLLKKYLGLGYYSPSDSRIEYKIPYHSLASLLGTLSEEYINIISILEQAYGYQDLSEESKKTLLSLGFNIENYSKEELYAFLSFKLWQRAKILENKDYLNKEFVDECLQIAFKNRLTKHNHYKEKDIPYLDQETEYIDRENEEIKRALKKENIAFHL